MSLRLVYFLCHAVSVTCMLSIPSQTLIQLTYSAPSLEEVSRLEVVGGAMVEEELTSVLEDQECISNFDIFLSPSLFYIIYTNLFHCAYTNMPSHSSVMLLSMPQKCYLLCNVCTKYTNIAIV